MVSLTGPSRRDRQTAIQAMARSTLPHTIREALAAAGARLTGLADGSPRLEAELLLAEATGLSRTQLLTRGEAILAADAGQRYAVLVNRRVQGEPIAYIIGQQGFWTLDLDVSAATLIPRPETELLVELALARLPVGVSLVVADLGTGSGAVAAALAYERPDWTLVATDRSVEAIRVARANARRLGLANLRTLAGDWLDAFAPNSLDAVLGNPPYIPANDPHINRGDLRYEPRSALAAGLDGLEAIRRIAAQVPGRLKSGGLLALEHGFDQGPAVRGILTRVGLAGVMTLRDLAGHERVTLAERGPAASTGSCIGP
jgi:release factor glutamine methyltransferase